MFTTTNAPFLLTNGNKESRDTATQKKLKPTSVGSSSVSTKRKLSETFNTTNTANESLYSDNIKNTKSAKLNKKQATNVGNPRSIKTPPVYATPTPSPPQSQYAYTNFNAYSNAYNSHNQQMYANPAFSYSFDNTPDVNNYAYQSYHPQQQANYAQQHLELQKNAIYTTHNNLYFNTNTAETYAAYF